MDIPKPCSSLSQGDEHWIPYHTRSKYLPNLNPIRLHEHSMSLIWKGTKIFKITLVHFSRWLHEYLVKYGGNVTLKLGESSMQPTNFGYVLNASIMVDLCIVISQSPSHVLNMKSSSRYMKITAFKYTIELQSKWIQI